MMRKTSYAVVVLLATTGLVRAEDAEIMEGRQTYERYCASCHGAKADGQGPMRAVLLVQPSDLTLLSVENDGVFPLERVVKRIDGRDPLVSHGSQMPVYGDFFDTEGTARLESATGETIDTTRPVVDLVAYLRSLQAE